MANLRCDYFSKSLQMNTSFVVSFPDDSIIGDLPVIFVFHGLTDNCTTWGRYASIEWEAYKHPAFLVMPEVQRSFYSDMKHGVNYFEYVSVELPQFIRNTFHTNPDKEKNFLMGISMGGYGALKCALTYPENYKACAAFSSVIDIISWLPHTDMITKEELKAVWGQNLVLPEKDNILALLDKCPVEKMPYFYLCCGKQDSLYPDSVKIANLFENKNNGFDFETWNGEHNWEFWGVCMRKAFEKFISP